MSDIAISVENVTKLYKLYDKPSDRFREALGLSKKKRYKEHYALHNLDFQIKKGECVGIIGTNGAGKSTILKIITGVLNPSEGDVKIDGIAGGVAKQPVVSSHYFDEPKKCNAFFLTALRF